MGTPHTSFRETSDARYDCVFLGSVVDNDDPLKIGRVRVFVPGLLDPESAWALPMGHMYGVKCGSFWVPEVGSNVAVFLNQGDIDHPLYIPGNFGRPDSGSDVPDHILEDKNIATMCWRDLSLTFDGRPGQENIEIKDFDSDSYIKIDRTSGNISINANETIDIDAKNRHSRLTEDEVIQVFGDHTHNVDGDRLEITNGNITEVVNGTLTTTATAISLSSLVSPLNIVAAALNVTSTGVENSTSQGLATKNFLGGIIYNVTGAVDWTVSGLYRIASSNIILGSGGNPLPLLTTNFITNFMTHTHLDSTGGLTGTAIYNPSPSDYTSNVKAT
jgi:hypothetical protein